MPSRWRHKPTTVLILLAALFLLGPGQAVAQEIGLAERTCTVRSDLDADWQHIAGRARDCGDDRFVLGKEERVWGITDLRGADLPDEPLVWQTDSSLFDALLLRFDYADGTVVERRYTTDVARQAWFAGTRYSLAVPHRDAPLTRIVAAFDRPHHSANLYYARLMPKAASEVEHFRRALIFMLVIGMLVIPIFYDAAFYLVLRERFMLVHATMAAGMVVYVLSTSGLIFMLMPWVGATLRAWLSQWAFSAFTICGMVFLAAVVEPRMLDRLHRRLLAAAALLMAATVAILTLVGEPLRAVANDLYLLTYVPVAAAMLFAANTAARRGSRAIRYVIAGWGAIFLAGGERIVRGLGLYDAPPALDDVIFLAFAVETIFTSLGVADRFIAIRRERDAAQQREQEMRRLAESDPLTGLFNRRMFDRESLRGPDCVLALIDIDRFKAINDCFGHQVGDAVLRATGAALAEACRTRDSSAAYRIGGEEFALVFKASDAATARRFADRTRKAVTARIAAEVDAMPYPVTLSVGISEYRGEDADACFVAADQALYSAKNAGRDRVVLAPQTWRDAA